jgi:hypothetical protein
MRGQRGLTNLSTCCSSSFSALRAIWTPLVARPGSGGTGTERSAFIRLSLSNRPQLSAGREEEEEDAEEEEEEKA